MDWTKHKQKRFITIEEALEQLSNGDLDVKHVKEVVNTAIDEIIEQTGADLKVVHAARNLIEALNI